MATTSVHIPAAEEIAFPAHGHARFVVHTGPSTEFGRDQDAVHVPGPDSEFENMGGIAAVLAALLPTVVQQAPELIELCLTDRDLFPLDPEYAREAGLGVMSQTIRFAVIRRVSRESHQAALTIDRIARTIIEAGRRCARFAGGLRLTIADLHRWDRPSLRCLYRAVVLAERDDHVSVRAHADLPAITVDDPDDFEALEAASRRQFFAKLASTGVVDLRMPEAGIAPERTGVQPIDDALVDDALENMADALVLQNYEQIYRLCAVVLASTTDREQLAQARRLAGVAATQLQQFEIAKHQLLTAVGLTSDEALTAHLLSLLGLIETKRNYDRAAAVGYYAQGLAGLAGLSEPRHATERAWLLNGRALVHTLEARAAARPDRAALFGQAFELEFEAFGLIRDIRTLEAAYLRHNLMANIVFLLEITHRFDEAIRFWMDAFDPYLADGNPGFQVAFKARLGLLHCQAGDPARGLPALHEALSVAKAAHDHFSSEDVLLKLGYAYSVDDDWHRAYLSYHQAFEMAHTLREADVCAEAITGMLWCLAELGDAEGVDRLAGAARDALPDTRLGAALSDLTGHLPDALRLAGITQPMPSPKSRAYIPAVDLEGTPGHDLNRLLVWGKGPVA